MRNSLLHVFINNLVYSSSYSNFTVKDIIIRGGENIVRPFFVTPEASGKPLISCPSISSSFIYLLSTSTPSWTPLPTLGFGFGGKCALR